MMLLSNGYRVRVLDNFETGHYRNVLFHTEPVEYKIGDIQKPLDCEEALRDIEMVFHLVMPAFNSSSEETFFAKPTALSHWGRCILQLVRVYLY